LNCGGRKNERETWKSDSDRVYLVSKAGCRSEAHIKQRARGWKAWQNYFGGLELRREESQDARKETGGERGKLEAQKTRYEIQVEGSLTI